MISKNQIKTKEVRHYKESGDRVLVQFIELSLLNELRQQLKDKLPNLESYKEIVDEVLCVEGESNE